MKRWKRWAALLLCALLWLPAVPAFAAEETPVWRGIDVSRWQGTVDWAKVKQAGVDFAVLRCYAYRKDTTFDANYAGATAQGIPVGAYVYMYATTEQGAVQEAQATLDAIAGKPMTLPLFLDVEDSSIKTLGRSKLTDLMLIELAIFAAAGYPTGIYTSQSYVSSYMDASRLQDYDWWLARWTCYRTDANNKLFSFSDESPASAKKPDCAVWQFSNGGRGSAYGAGSTAVDLNFCYKDYFSAGPYTPNEHRYNVTVHPADCVNPGYLAMQCSHCGQQITKFYTPALGHTAPGADGTCGRCGLQLTDVQNGDLCPLCGQAHRGPLGILTLFVHRLLLWLKRSVI